MLCIEVTVLPSLCVLCAYNEDQLTIHVWIHFQGLLYVVAFWVSVFILVLCCFN